MKRKTYSAGDRCIAFESISTFQYTAEAENLPTHWGSRGFSLNIGSNGNDIALCYGYPKPTKPNQTPQSLYTAFREVTKKVEGVDQLIDDYRQKFINTGIFIPAGEIEVKYLINEKPRSDLVTEILTLLHELSMEIERLERFD